MRRAPHPVTIGLIRVLPVAGLGGLIAALLAGAAAAAQLLLLVTILLGPVLLPRKLLYPPDGGSSADDADGGGGGGRGPRPAPTKPPDAPRGGLPLPDAQPARLRLRDHGRPVLTPPQRRRAAREPERVPERVRIPRRVKR